LGFPRIWPWAFLADGASAIVGTIRAGPKNVMANCLTEFSAVWAYNPMKDDWKQIFEAQK
jgi:hypothetical protein